MPKVMITARPDWFPSRASAPPINEMTAGGFTYSLSRDYVPRFVSETLNATTSAEPISSDTVVVGYTEAYPFVDDNFPDIWVELFLFETESRLSAQEQIRDSMLELICDWTDDRAERLDRSGLLVPQIDFDVYITPGGGGSIDRTPTVTHKWGCMP